MLNIHIFTYSHVYLQVYEDICISMCDISHCLTFAHPTVPTIPLDPRILGDEGSAFEM